MTSRTFFRKFIIWQLRAYLIRQTKQVSRRDWLCNATVSAKDWYWFGTVNLINASTIMLSNKKDRVQNVTPRQSTHFASFFVLLLGICVHPQTSWCAKQISCSHPERKKKSFLSTWWKQRVETSLKHGDTYTWVSEIKKEKALVGVNLVSAQGVFKLFSSPLCGDVSCICGTPSFVFGLTAECAQGEHFTKDTWASATRRQHSRFVWWGSRAPQRPNVKEPPPVDRNWQHRSVQRPVAVSVWLLCA